MTHNPNTSMPQIDPNNSWIGDSTLPSLIKRANRYQRPEPVPMHLMERDERIIARCWEDKLLSTSDLQAIFFGARARCIHRLKLLYSNHYLDRHFLPILWPYRGATEALYTVGKRGNAVVSMQLGLEQSYVARKRRQLHEQMRSPGFLLTFRHLRSVNQTRIRFEQTFGKAQDAELVRWIPERQLEDRFTATRDGQVRRSRIRADGFLHYRHTPTQKCYSAFVEVDLGSMSQRQIQAKVHRYLNYFQTPLPRERYGTHLFRVLFLTTTARRAWQLKQFIRPLTDSIFWVTHFGELETDDWLSESIWFRPGHSGTHALVQ